MRVRILMATFNGERYLDAQLASIARQTWKDWDLVVSDDGSTDTTPEVLQEFSHTHAGRVATIDRTGGGRGAHGNFAHLLADHADVDYLALADQDDVWHPERLERGLRAVQEAEEAVGPGVPVLVHSDLALIDENACRLHPSMHRAQNLQALQRRSLRQLLPHNNVTGCSITMNRALRDVAVPIPDRVVMHDWWLALVAAAFGRVEVIDRPLVGYRQHHANAVGAKPFTAHEVLRQSRQIGLARSRLRATFVQAEAFLDRYADRLSDGQRQLVTAYACLPSMSPVRRRSTMLRHRFTKPGYARTAGMFALL